MPYQLDARGDIRGQDLLAEAIEISTESGEGRCAGLVESSLISGTLRLAHKDANVGLNLSTISDSKVIALKKQRNFNFFRARFINCTFMGTYSGMDFGHRQRPGMERDEFGRVENCDFTQATLDACRFVNTDISTLKLPLWPHVVLPMPHQLAPAVASIDWPGSLGGFLRVCTATDPIFTATVLHLPSLTKSEGFAVEEARSAFERLNGVLM